MPTKPTPKEAVLRGHLMVTVPVLVTIATVAAFVSIVLGRPMLGFGVGAFAAWPVWSFMVPRWRDWVIDVGLTPDDVQDKAELTGLLWPRGSFLERTEFKRRSGRVGW